jgi:hypothetical protein
LRIPVNPSEEDEMSRRVVTLVLALAAAGVSVPAAAGDGSGASPSVSILGTGIGSPNGTVHYIALPDGSRTLVVESMVRGGAIVGEVAMRGLYGIPFVATDGTLGGLSRDGRTLVLGELNKRQGARTTRFPIVDLRHLRVRKVLTLPGDFTFDALSPDGRTLYLIENLSYDTSGYVHYRVRSLDIASGRLEPRVIVDRRSASEAMAGSPVTRATSRGGVWTYTLYQRPNGTAFIHALDTRRAEAACIDLPWKDVRAWVYDARLRLSRDGRQLYLRQLGIGGRTAVIDTRSWKVRVSSPV